jgi:hypothetical protein
MLVVLALEGSLMLSHDAGGARAGRVAGVPPLVPVAFSLSIA